MRELTEQEAEKVAGGDGIKLPGGGYISSTRNVFNAQGAFGALSMSLSGGLAVGSAINYAYERSTGSTIGYDMHSWVERNS